MGDALILCYHRVVEAVPEDPFDPLTRYGLCVALRRFQGQMECLARRCRVVSLDDLVASLDRRGQRRTLAAVSFDDGYADNYLHAMPVFQRVGIPVTVFLTTSNVGSGIAFWWDRLAWYLSRHAGYPVALPPSLGGPTVVPKSPEELYQLFDVLHGRLSVLEASARDAVLDAMADEATPSSLRPLTWEEVERMSAKGVAFGAHSVSHSSLVAMSDAALRYEIEHSREEVVAHVRGACTVFSYPFGYVDDRVAKAVESAGYRAAVTVRPARFDRAAPRYALPRWSVRPAEREDFSESLRRLPGGTKRVLSLGRVRRVLGRALSFPVRTVGRHWWRAWQGRVRS